MDSWTSRGGSPPLRYGFHEIQIIRLQNSLNPTHRTSPREPSPPGGTSLGVVRQQHVVSPMTDSCVDRRLVCRCLTYGEGVMLRDVAHRLEDPARTLQLFVESVVDYALFILDPEGFIVSWNRGAERIKGYNAHDIIGQHFSVFYPA